MRLVPIVSSYSPICEKKIKSTKFPNHKLDQSCLMLQQSQQIAKGEISVSLKSKNKPIKFHCKYQDSRNLKGTIKPTANEFVFHQLTSFNLPSMTNIGFGVLRP